MQRFNCHAASKVLINSLKKRKTDPLGDNTPQNYLAAPNFNKLHSLAAEL